MDRLPGTTVVEFGTPWCGHCQRAQPLIEQALKDHPEIVHLKVEDGPGQRLGRTYGVKLWPTLVFLKDGKEVARLVDGVTKLTRLELQSERTKQAVVVRTITQLGLGHWSAPV